MSLPSELLPVGLLGTGATGGYEIERSLRFNSADSAYLSRTPASAGNRKTWTWAGWVKNAFTPSAYPRIFSAGSTNADTLEITLMASSDGSELRILGDVANSRKLNWTTINKFRDPSAWFHLVVALDTTQGTASNRLKVYVNGSQITTAGASSTLPSQDDVFEVNNSSIHYIGRSGPYTEYFNGYLADIHFIDGQALDPTSFGEFDENGIWQPKRYSGTYGSQGWKLDFADNSSNTATTLGKDTSGNGNNWTPNNLSVLDGRASVAAASGALPIFNTTDTYGNTKGTGTRTDSNSSSIVLALPMDGANNGTTFTDESATIKGSGSAKSITRNGDTKTSTAQSKFYGSSGYFDGTGDYLSVTSADFVFGTGDYTVEGWIYSTSTTWTLYATGGPGSSDQFVCDGGTLYWDFQNSSGTSNYFTTADTNRWVHVCVSRSGTTLRIFKDGIIVRTVTSSISIGSSQEAYIGVRKDLLYYITGYIQDLRVYKGVAKYTSNFNPPSSTANPTIAAGNDSLIDVPQNGTQTDTGLGGEVRGNYCTLNPLKNGSGSTLSNGNLAISGTAGNSTLATIGVSSGKWYFEYVTTTIASNNDTSVGIANVTIPLGSAFAQSSLGYGVYSYGLNSFIKKGNNATYTDTNASPCTNGDVISIAFDIDAGKIWFAKNGTWMDSGNPSTGANAMFSGISGTFSPYATPGGAGTGSVSCDINFGQRPFAYTAPSGFKALNTANLPTPTILDGSDYMDVLTYTGNGSTQTISGLEFSPDLVWLKARSAAYGNYLSDTVRGITKDLYSHATNAEYEEPTLNGITAVTSNGFSLGNDIGRNNNTTTYVAWTWDAGSTTVTNTDGSITSSVRANPSAGFSIVTWTQTGSSGDIPTVGHGLGATPAFLIVKDRFNSPRNWRVYHTSLGVNQNLTLNDTSAAVTVGSPPAYSVSSTTFGLKNGQVLDSGDSLVAYCFAPVEGYSAFGSYTGNGSADGPFVYTGFRPRWVLVKMSSGTSSWQLLDSARSDINVMDDALFPNLSNAEISTSAYNTDFLSNGFKIRDADSFRNGNGSTFIYVAFAENPFKYARAR